MLPETLSTNLTLLNEDQDRIAVVADMVFEADGSLATSDLYRARLHSALGIPVAAGVLHPFFGLRLSPITAGAAMSLSPAATLLTSSRERRSGSRAVCAPRIGSTGYTVRVRGKIPRLFDRALGP
jgi:hypothetical protein